MHLVYIPILVILIILYVYNEYFRYSLFTGEWERVGNSSTRYTFTKEDGKLYLNNLHGGIKYEGIEGDSRSIKFPLWTYYLDGDFAYTRVSGGEAFVFRRKKAPVAIAAM